jgi:ABC-2 type transport system ATP-binding protein
MQWMPKGWPRSLPGQFEQIEERLHHMGVKVVRNRVLELDEILGLWTQGYCPILVDDKKGD